MPPDARNRDSLFRRRAVEVYVGPFPNGLSDCCSAQPYRVNNGPWMCGKCSGDCDRVRPQRQDSTTEQLHDVVAMAERAGCYDAADCIKRRLLDA